MPDLDESGKAYASDVSFSVQMHPLKHRAQSRLSHKVIEAAEICNLRLIYFSSGEQY